MIYIVINPYTRDPFYKHGWTLIPTWINDHMPSKVWGQVNHPFPNFNCATVEVWEWISNFISHFIMDISSIIKCDMKLLIHSQTNLSMLALTLNRVSKKGPRSYPILENKKDGYWHLSQLAGHRSAMLLLVMSFLIQCSPPSNGHIYGYIAQLGLIRKSMPLIPLLSIYKMFFFFISNIKGVPCLCRL